MGAQEVLVVAEGVRAWRPKTSNSTAPMMGGHAGLARGLPYAAGPATVGAVLSRPSGMWNHNGLA